MSKPFSITLPPAQAFPVPVTVTERSGTDVLLLALRIAELTRPTSLLAHVAHDDIAAELASRLSPIPIAARATTERRAA